MTPAEVRAMSVGEHQVFTDYMVEVIKRRTADA